MNSNSDIKQEGVKRTEPSSSSLSKRPLWQQRGAPSPAHTVSLAPELMHHFWTAVISIWWMFSGCSGAHGPQPASQQPKSLGAAHRGDCASAPGGPLYFYPPALQSLDPESHNSSQSIHPALLPILQFVVCVCMCTRACSHVLVTGLHQLPTAILVWCLGPSSQLYCLHLAWWMAGCLISPSTCNLKWFPGALYCLQVWSLSPACALPASFTYTAHARQTGRIEAQNYTQMILFCMYSSNKRRSTRAETMHQL